MSNNGGSILNHTLDDYFKTTMIGSIRQSITNNLYGINHRKIPNMVPSNKDTYGYTFFVRPQLNLTAPNIANNRLFFPLLTREPNSLHSFVRNTLDPRSPVSNVVDNTFPFIPVLTNNLVSISGWDDLMLPTQTTSEGNYGESYSYVDGTIANYKTYDIDATFKNTRGDPIMYLFYVWLLYSSAVFEGTMAPYPDFIIENEIDYNTRIYRLVMDQTNTYVRKILASGVSFPITLPTGGFFDFNSDKPYNDQVGDFSIKFRCIGMTYQDNILTKEFNECVSIFNADMRVVNETHGAYSYSDVVMIPPYLLPIFNNRGYPRINPSTSRLEWWVSSTVYNDRITSLLGAGNITENYQLLKDAQAAMGKDGALNKGPTQTTDAGGYIENVMGLGESAVNKTIVTSTQTVTTPKTILV